MTADPDPDALTLTYAGQSLAKQVQVHDGIVTRVDDPHWPKLVRFSTGAISNPLHLLKVLTRAADRDPAPCVVRGDPLTDIGRRAIYDNEDGPAGLRILPRRWTGYDIENVPAGGIDPLNEPERAVAHARQCLPPQHRDVSCVWQITASAGKRPDELRLRLWFLLDRPLLGRQLAAWCRPGIDSGWLDPSTLINEVLPNFIAVRITGTSPDPCPRRWGLIWGERERVPVPDHALVLPQRDHVRDFSNFSSADRDAREAELVAQYGEHLTRKRRGAICVIRDEVEAVRRAVPGTRHPTYVHAAARIYGLCRFWALPLERARERLEEAYLETLTPDEVRQRSRGSIAGIWSWLDRRTAG